MNISVSPQKGNFYRPQKYFTAFILATNLAIFSLCANTASASQLGEETVNNQFSSAVLTISSFFKLLAPAPAYHVKDLTPAVANQLQINIKQALKEVNKTCQPQKKKPMNPEIEINLNPLKHLVIEVNEKRLKGIIYREEKELILEIKGINRPRPSCSNGSKFPITKSFSSKNLTSDPIQNSFEKTELEILALQKSPAK